jgi:hypothetical protein
MASIGADPIALSRVPGDHLTALRGPQFRDDIATFLTGPEQD